MALAKREIRAISPVDRLGEIKAQIAALKEIEAALISEVRDLGVGAHDGDKFRASVAEVAERQSLDVKAAEAKLIELGVDGRWFAKHQKTTAAYTVVKVTSRLT